MPENGRRESPLARFGLPDRPRGDPSRARVIAAERAFLCHVNVRGDARDAAFVAAVRSVLGVEPPVEPNTVARRGDVALFWLGPDEWLVIAPTAEERGLAARLASACGGLHAAVTEVGGGQTVLTLEGPAVRDLLSEECPLDLHPRAFRPGTCAQSRLAKAPILLCLRDDAATFELVVRRSFADYLWTWLEDAGAEYGLAVIAAR